MISGARAPTPRATGDCRPIDSLPHGARAVPSSARSPQRGGSAGTKPSSLAPPRPATSPPPQKSQDLFINTPVYPRAPIPPRRPRLESTMREPAQAGRRQAGRHPRRRDDRQGYRSAAANWMSGGRSTSPPRRSGRTPALRGWPKYGAGMGGTTTTSGSSGPGCQAGFNAMFLPRVCGCYIRLSFRDALCDVLARRGISSPLPLEGGRPGWGSRLEMKRPPPFLTFALPNGRHRIGSPPLAALWNRVG
jgi:hypothetical protein